LKGTLRIDLGDPKPAYRQIADALRTMLVGAEGPAPGEQLPTVRKLAIDLGVHHNTVAQAYRLLADEGWLELTRGRGAVVRQREVPTPADASRERFRNGLAVLVSEALGRGIPRDWLIDELGVQVVRMREEGSST
jgi:GntR family transcriptional regulator